MKIQSCIIIEKENTQQTIVILCSFGEFFDSLGEFEPST